MDPAHPEGGAGRGLVGFVHGFSAAGALDRAAVGRDERHHALDVVALDLDDAVLCRAAAAARVAQLATVGGQRVGVETEPAHDITVLPPRPGFSRLTRTMPLALETS